MIKNIIFDLGNVLVDFCWEKDFINKGLKGEIFERVADATTRNSDWNEYDRGILSYDEILDMFIENDPEMEEYIRIAVSTVNGMIEKYPYTDALIKDLQDSGYKVYILSNFSERGFTESKDTLDFVKNADGAIISYMHKIIKPDKEIYMLLLDKYGLKADECVFIDDKVENIEGAERCGIKGIKFTGLDDAVSKLNELGVGVKLDFCGIHNSPLSYNR